MANTSQFVQSLFNDREVIIEQNNYISNVVDLQNSTIIGLVFPQELEGNKNKFNGNRICFYVSSDKQDFHQLRDTENNLIVLNCLNNVCYSLNRYDLAAWNYIKIQSDTAQTNDITITLQTRAGS